MEGLRRIQAQADLDRLILTRQDLIHRTPFGTMIRLLRAYFPTARGYAPDSFNRRSDDGRPEPSICQPRVRPIVLGYSGTQQMSQIMIGTTLGVACGVESISRSPRCVINMKTRDLLCGLGAQTLYLRSVS